MLKRAPSFPRWAAANRPGANGPGMRSRRPSENRHRAQVKKLAFQLWPTAWALGAGHQLKLELTPDDSPTWRPDNLAATMTLTNVSLTLPVHA